MSERFKRIELSGNSSLEVFRFITTLHDEVVIRVPDEESEDIEMTPDEARILGEALISLANIKRDPDDL